MDVFLRIDINLVAVILLSVTLFVAYGQLDKKDSLNKVYIRIAFIVIIELLAEAGTCIINSRGELWMIPITYFLHICLFGIAPILSYFWYYMVINMVDTTQHTLKKNHILFLLPALFSIILTILSPIYHFVFYIDASNIYHRGSLFSITMIFTYFYIAYGLVIIILNRRKIVKEEFLPICIFAFLPLVGAFLQGFFYGILFMWSSVAFSLVVVYIFLQERMVHLDALTGAWDRNAFQYYIRQNMRKIDQVKLGMIYVDIDKLKEVNDNFGHLEGDIAIKTAVSILRKAIPQNAIIARLGGDEFIIIFNDEMADNLTKIMKEIKTAFNEFNKVSVKEYKLECSLGADIFTAKYRSIEQFLNHIDNLMYQDKRGKSAADESESEIYSLREKDKIKRV